MYICVFWRSDGAGNATSRNTRGLTRSVMALMVPLLPAASRPSNTTMTRTPLCFTHSWRWHNSAWSFRNSFMYFLPFIFLLLLVSSSLFLLGFDFLLILGAGSVRASSVGSLLIWASVSLLVFGCCSLFIGAPGLSVVNHQAI